VASAAKFVSELVVILNQDLQASAIDPHFTSGFLPFALRARLRLFKIAPGDFVAGMAVIKESKQKIRRHPGESGDLVSAGTNPSLK
jgi:hypothetical protein